MGVQINIDHLSILEHLELNTLMYPYASYQPARNGRWKYQYFCWTSIVNLESIISLLIWFRIVENTK
jgi:hypothetical protein